VKLWYAEEGSTFRQDNEENTAMSYRWQQIEQIYHATLECEEIQRTSYLHEVCAGDDELRREVESLLAREKWADLFLESPALDVSLFIRDSPMPFSRCSVVFHFSFFWSAASESHRAPTPCHADRLIEPVPGIEPRRF
jgi:hypothetical protein